MRTAPGAVQTRRGTHPCVEIAGIQGRDGRVLRRIGWLDPGRYGAELDAAGLRKLSEHCLATADELDRLEK